MILGGVSATTSDLAVAILILAQYTLVPYYLMLEHNDKVKTQKQCYSQVLKFRIVQV